MISLQEFVEYSKVQDLRLRKVFDEIDQDHSGFVSYEEVSGALTEIYDY